MRLFVALWTPPEVLEALPLARIREAITRQGVRFTAPEKIHLTLRFLGNVLDDDLERLVSSLASNLEGVEAPELSVAGLDAFPGLHRPKTVWLGVQGDLALLHGKTIEATEDFAERTEEKQLTPHLTLARVSPPSQKVGRAIEPVAQALGDTVFATWKPTEVVLAQTMPNGGYEHRATFPLIG